MSRARTGTIGAWAWSAFRLAEVRLRIPIVLVIAALVVGRWDVLRNYWDRLTRRSTVESIAQHAISSDTEYFCPMDPGIVSDWPGRCGVCNMVLVRRKRGEAMMLPDGVVARMQLSPYRVQLAGIQTSPVDYRPLEREWRATGLDRARRRGRDGGRGAAVAPGDLGRGGAVGGGRECGPPRPGTFRRAGSLAGPGHGRRPGIRPRDDRDRQAAARAPRRAGRRRPVPDRRGRDRSVPRRCRETRRPLLSGEPRRVFLCPDHPETIALEPGRCPVNRKEREPRALGELERLRWWCPMHPGVTADRAGASCRECGGMALQPRVNSYSPAGQVLAVPQSAVVDTGARKVVFVEGMPGMFDGVEVVLGSRCGDFYPVVRGLEPGQRIATAGAFLLDAETRLNPSLAASYFGAARSDRAAAPAGRPSVRAEMPPPHRPSRSAGSATRTAPSRSDRSSAP